MNNSEKINYHVFFCFILIIVFELFFIFKGFNQSALGSSLIQHWWPIIRNFLYLSIATLTFHHLSKFKKINPYFFGFISLCLISLISNNILPLFIAIIFGFSSLALGNQTLSFFKFESANIHFISRLLLGSGLYASIISLTARYPINSTMTFAFLLIIPLVFRYKDFKSLLNIDHFINLKKFHFTWHDSLITLLLIYYFLLFLMPEVGHDALSGHLFIAGQMSQIGSWSFNVSNYVWAVMPMLADWIFTFGYMISGEAGSRLLNYGALCLLALLIRDFIIYLGGNASGVKWALLLFLSTPLTFLEGSTHYVELIWSLFLLSTIYEFIRSFYRKNGLPNLYVTPILFAFSAASKAVSLCYIPGLLIVFFINIKSIFKKINFFHFFIIIIIGSLIALIPYINAWLITGNPIFPFFNAFFKSKFYALSNFDNPIYSKGLTWDILYRVTFNTEKYLESSAGGAGFYWILLFIPTLYITIVAYNKKILSVLLFAIAGAVFTFMGSAYIRYIFISYILLCLCSGCLIQEYCKNYFSKVLVILCCIVVLLNLIFIKSATNYGDINEKVIFNSNAREAYLLQRLPIKKAVEIINQINFNREPVLFLSQPFAAGLNADALHSNWYNNRIPGKLNKIHSNSDTNNFLVEEKIKYIILDENFKSTYFDVNKVKEFIIASSDLIFNFESIHIRRVKSQIRYHHELINSPHFEDLKSWNFDSAIKQIPGRAFVSAQKPFSQAVNIQEYKFYQLTAKVNCNNSTSSYRMQINWLDNNEFISTFIKVFDCNTSNSENILEIQAPKGAKQAVVYASGYDNNFITFTTLSLKD